MAVFDVFAYTPLFLTDSVVTNIKVVNVGDTVALSDSVTTNIKQVSVKDSLLLNDSVALNKSIDVAAQDILHLDQDGRRTPIDVVAADHLIMWHEADAPKNYPLVEHVLALTDLAVAAVAKAAYDTLVISQSVTVEKSISVLAENTLAMKSNATVYKPDQYWTSYDVVVVNP